MQAKEKVIHVRLGLTRELFYKQIMSSTFQKISFCLYTFHVPFHWKGFCIRAVPGGFSSVLPLRYIYVVGMIYIPKNFITNVLNARA